MWGPNQVSGQAAKPLHPAWSPCSSSKHLDLFICRHGRTHAHAHARARTHTRARVCARMHARTYTPIHTHTHTHERTHTCSFDRLFCAHAAGGCRGALAPHGLTVRLGARENSGGRVAARAPGAGGWVGAATVRSMRCRSIDCHCASSQNRTEERAIPRACGCESCVPGAACRGQGGGSRYAAARTLPLVQMGCAHGSSLHASPRRWWGGQAGAGWGEGRWEGDWPKHTLLLCVPSHPPPLVHAASRPAPRNPPPPCHSGYQLALALALRAFTRNGKCNLCSK